MNTECISINEVAKTWGTSIEQILLYGIDGKITISVLSGWWEWESNLHLEEQAEVTAAGTPFHLRKIQLVNLLNNGEDDLSHYKDVYVVVDSKGNALKDGEFETRGFKYPVPIKTENLVILKKEKERFEQQGITDNKDKEDKPDKEQSTTNKFQDMIDLKWEEVVITFVHPERVKISARNYNEERTFEDMGFSDGRAKTITKPDRKWDILKGICINGGELDYSKLQGKESQNAKQYLTAIRIRLRDFMRIDGDPIPWKFKSRKYKTAFHAASTMDHQDSLLWAGVVDNNPDGDDDFDIEEFISNQHRPDY